jgi:hypothetical protein
MEEFIHEKENFQGKLKEWTWNESGNIMGEQRMWWW